MPRFDVYPLKWDSDFFSINCGKVILNEEVSVNEFEKIKEEIKDYDFVSISNLHNNEANNRIIGENSSAFLADVNIQFTKKIVQASCNDESIEISNNFFSDDLTKIAEKAYVNSKFIKDENFKKKNGAMVYCKWLENAYGKDDKYFAVYKKGEECLGYILFSFTDDKAVIELIATDEKARNMGIATKLINALQSYLYENRIEMLDVGTQLNNIAAVNFYHKCGFKETDRVSVYHMWK